MSLVLQEFNHKSKYWTNLNFDLRIALDEMFRVAIDLAMQAYNTIQVILDCA